MSIIKNLNETNKQNQKSLEIVKLDFNLSQLDPILNENNVELHYNTHTKNYFKKAKSIGDRFNVNGAKLHNIYWSQLSPNQDNNDPTGKIKTLIEDEYKSFSNFKTQFIKICMTIEGSGWVFLDGNGTIGIIENHKKVPNMILLQDCWEHAYYPTYGPNKEKYFTEFFKIVNWIKVNELLS